MSFVDKVVKEEDLLWNKVNDDVPIVFWGCGNNAYIVRKLLEQKGIYPSVYCDNNQACVGQKIEGVDVLSYQQLKARYKKYYIILALAIHNAIEVKAQLLEAKDHNMVFHMEKPFKVDNEMLEYEYLREHASEFDDVYEMLHDDLSKKIFIENINFRISGNKMNLLQYVDGDSFFDDRVIPMSSIHSYVDVGAYTGDTLLRFYAFCGGKYNKIYAIEPDEENFIDLKKMVKAGRIDNVSLFNVGGWDCKNELTFYTAKNKNDRNFDSPNFFKCMSETMPSSCGIEFRDFEEKKISVDTVDNLLNLDECSIIKINALAADLQVLKGSRKTIEKWTPVIVGEFGTRKQNLTEMLRFIKEVNSKYDIYLRQKMIFGDCKTIFLAIDKK